MMGSNLETIKKMASKVAVLLKRRKVWIAISLVVAVVVFGFARSRTRVSLSRQDGLEATHKVARQTLVIDMVESGTLKAKKSTPIAARIQRQATILYVVDEGSLVAEGAVLVELDKTDLERDMERELISLEQGEGDVAQKEKDIEIKKIQDEGELTKAELKVEMARMDMEKYEKGEGPQKIKEAEANRKKAERDMRGMPQLLEKGFVTENELLDAQVALDKAKTAHDILMTYTHPKNLKKNKSDYEEAVRELEATKARIEAAMAQKESALNRARRQLGLRKKAVEKLQKDLDSMTLKAPNEGIVIYGSGDPHDWRAREIKVGGNVYGRQTIITLPDMSVMQVACQVHEVDVDKVKVGQDTEVRIEAYPDLKFKGRVENISLMAKQKGRWGLSDVKVFDVDITLEGNDPCLKPGMTAKATIHIDRLDDVICVPVEAVFEEEEKYYCYLLESRRRRKVEIHTGRSNDNFVEVTGGLEEGNVVLLAASALTEESTGGR